MHLKGKEDKSKNLALKKKSKWEFHLYKFKTAKFQKELPIIMKAKPEENEFMSKFVLLYKHNEPLVVSVRNNKLSRKSLNVRINKIFKRVLCTKKEIGVSLLRYIYLTEILKGEKTIEEKKQIVKAFQHSPSISQLYIKVS